MPKYKIIESFRWLGDPKYTVHPVGKNKVRIKGVALRSDIISKNKRKYVDEELIRSARTLAGKKLTINHDDNDIAGNVELSDYEDGFLEYVALVNKQPYVRYLRNHDPRIKGVSVQADYLYNRCPKCGERFYSDDDFWQHMATEHFVKRGESETEPHGIIFSALSLVVDPEVPGVEGTTTELWETLQHSSPLQLLEIVTNTKKQELEFKEKMKKAQATISSEKSIALGKAPIKEQEKPTEEYCKEHPDDPRCKPAATEQDEDIKPGSHYCEEHPEDPRCKEHKKAIHGEEQTQQDLPKPTVKPASTCPEGFEDDGHGGCKPIEWKEEPTAKTPAPKIVPEPIIEPPKIVDPTLVAPAPVIGPVLEQDEQLPPAPFPTAPPEAPAVITQECLPGSHWDKLAGTCVPDEILEQPPGLEGRVDAGAPIVSEVKLPKFLSLGEPFSDYPNFEACVMDIMKKNPEYTREQAEGTCAKIEKQATGKYPSQETKETDNVYTLLNLFKREQHLTDRQFAESVNMQNRALAELTKTLAKQPADVQRKILAEARLRGAYVNQLGKTVQVEGKLRAGMDKQILEYVKNTVLAEAKLRGAFDTKILKQTQQIPNVITESNNTTRKYIKEVASVIIKANNESVTNLQGYTNEKLSQLATATAKLTQEQRQLQEKQKSDKQKYEKVLNSQESIFNALDEKYKTEFKSLEQRVKEQEDELKKHQCPEGEHYDEEQDKCVPDKPAEDPEKTEEIKETAELKARMDNLEAKLHGDFKGKSLAISKSDDDVLGHPDMRRKKKK